MDFIEKKDIEKIISNRLQKETFTPFAHTFVIAGMPCSGKTQTAQLLSIETGVPYIDSDDVIDEYLILKRTTVRNIFEKYGESFFRNNIEAVVCEILLVECQGLILSFGAQSLTLNRVIKLLNSNIHFVICLEVGINSIKQRLLSKPSLLENRLPLLNNILFLNELSERVKLYINRYGNYVIEADKYGQLSTSQIVKLILNKYKTYNVRQ